MCKQVKYAYSSTLGLLSCKSYFSPLKRKPTHRGGLHLITGCLWHTLAGCCTKCQHLIFHVATDPFVHIWNLMKTLCSTVIYSSLIIFTCRVFFLCFPLLCCSLIFYCKQQRIHELFYRPCVTKQCDFTVMVYQGWFIKSFYTNYMRNPQLTP